MLICFQSASLNWRINQYQSPLAGAFNERTPPAVRQLHSRIQIWQQKWNLTDQWIESIVMETLKTKNSMVNPARYRGPSFPGHAPAAIELPEQPQMPAQDTRDLLEYMRLLERFQDEFEPYKRAVAGIAQQHKIRRSNRQDGKPLRALALYQCLKNTTKQIADSTGVLGDDSSVDKAIKRLANEIGLTLRSGRRGRPKN